MTDYIWYVLTRAYWVTRWRLSKMRRRLRQMAARGGKS